MSHLNSTYECYIDCFINDRHRVYCCIDYVLVFALSTIIFDAYGTASKLNTGAQPTRSGNRQNLVSSQPIKLELGSVFIRIERTTRLGHYIVPFYPGTVLKNRVYVYKYCLVKHDLNWIVLYSNFLLLNTTVLNADWIGIATVISATIGWNVASLYCILML